MITAIDKHTALVLIDLQKGILKFPVIHPVKDVLEKSAQLVTAFRKAGLPVVVVHVKPLVPVVPTRKEIAASFGALPPDFAEIAGEIKTEATDIFITKHTWGAFYETPLQEELKKRGITGIVLAGIATSRGVESTARAAAERGYNISFASDAMTDMVAESHEHSLKQIFPRLGEVGTSAEIIAKLNSRN